MALKASAISAIAGWWGVPWGPIYTVADITRNAFGGYQPPGSKERLLWVNALAFTAAGQLRLAYALAREVRKTAEEEIANSASKLMDILRGEGLSNVPSLQDKWKVSVGHVIPHAMLLLAVPAAIFVLAQTASSSGLNSSGNSWTAFAPPPTTTNEPVPSTSAIGTDMPAAICSAPPENAEVLIDNTKWIEQENKLEIRNGSGGDAIIKIRSIETGSLLVSFLVKKDMTAIYALIPDGSYRIQYAFGDSLDESCKKFAKLTGAGEFSGENTFTTTDDGVYRQRTRLSFTLYAVPNGNVTPSTISSEQFNAE